MSLEIGVFNPKLESLYWNADSRNDNGQQIFGEVLLGSDSGAVIRNHFGSTASALLQQGISQKAEVVDTDPDFVCPVPVRIIHKYNKNELSDRQRDRLSKVIHESRRLFLQDTIAEHAWWTVFEDEQIYKKNVFVADPTEQFVVHGQNDETEVSVLNFGTPLSKRQVQDIVQGINTLSQCSRGAMRELVPNIVIHDDFLPTYFQFNGTYSVPAGQAWYGKPFIELDRSSIDANNFGSMGQSWLEIVIAHETSHQIDGFVNPLLPDFRRYFRYHDDNDDGVIDRVVPVASDFWDDHTNEEVIASKPANLYAFSPEEDCAVTAEEAVFGGKVDPLRRDAYLSLLQQFVSEFYDRPAEEVPLSVDYNSIKSFDVERRMGSSIELPTIPELFRTQRVQLVAAASIFEVFWH